MSSLTLPLDCRICAFLSFVGVFFFHFVCGQGNHPKANPWLEGGQRRGGVEGDTVSKKWKNKHCKDTLRRVN